jgi:hypothetical protein
MRFQPVLLPGISHTLDRIHGYPGVFLFIIQAGCGQQKRQKEENQPSIHDIFPDMYHFFILLFFLIVRRIWLKIKRMCIVLFSSLIIMHYEKKSVEKLWADKDTANSKRMNNNTDFLIL